MSSCPDCTDGMRAPLLFGGHYPCSACNGTGDVVDEHDSLTTSPITFYVIEEDGQPLDGAYVCVTTIDDTEWVSISDSKGKAHFYVSGPIKLFILRAEHMGVSMSIEVQPGDQYQIVMKRDTAIK